MSSDTDSETGSELQDESASDRMMWVDAVEEVFGSAVDRQAETEMELNDDSQACLHHLLPAKARTAPCGREQDCGGAGALWVRGRALAGPEGPELFGRAVAVATAFTPEPVGEERARAISSQQRSQVTTGRVSEASVPASTTDELER